MVVYVKLWILLTCVGLSVLLTILIGVYIPREASLTIAGLTMAVWLSMMGFLYVIYNRMATKLAYKQNLMSWMVNQVPGGFLSADVQGRITYINEGGRGILQSLYQKEREWIGAEVRDVFTLRENEGNGILWNSLAYGEVFHKVFLPIGDHMLVCASAPIIDPYTQQIVGVTAYFQDITEEERQVKQLEKLTTEAVEAAEELQTLLNFIPLSVLAIDQNERIVHFNDMALSVLPLLKREDIVGQKLKDFTESVGGKYEDLSLPKAMKGQRTVGKYSSHDSKSYLSYAYPIEKNGEIVGAIGIYQEITEVVQLKDERSQMERLSLVGQMAASITHEIRNPMAVVKGFIQLIKERTTEHEFQEYFVLILEELNRANEIINDFLSLAQNRNIPKERRDLNLIVKSLYPMIQADANLRGSRVELQLQPNLSELQLNEKEFKQLILNLVLNGLEAMKGSGVIKIETKQSFDLIELSISDTGMGIPKEMLGRIFEPFYTSKEKGTGLGLSVCLSIVQKHGGKMEARSVEGEGTTFVVTLPVSI